MLVTLPSACAERVGSRLSVLVAGCAVILCCPVVLRFKEDNAVLPRVVHHRI
jgi:hypothetical protein